MPEKMERALKKQAKKKRMPEKQKRRYVYGTMRKAGWKPKRERTT